MWAFMMPNTFWRWLRVFKCFFRQFIMDFCSAPFIPHALRLVLYLPFAQAGFLDDNPYPVRPFPIPAQAVFTIICPDHPHYFASTFSRTRRYLGKWESHN